jgi:3-hydroxyacyl-CoA dehydrogenase/enoyl-CoA hydratase/3-hydroxybutyryl-CoA epimerase
MFKLQPSARQSQTCKIWDLILDLPKEKVNILNAEVIRKFPEILSEVQSHIQKKEIDALVISSGKVGSFIAGADIQMIRSSKTEEEAYQLSRSGHKMFDLMEDLEIPVIAAIDGTALGGGCELSLACTAIVMSNSPAARIGLPEVLLGLLPGAGGSVRLPRKVGLATALDMILTGKTLTGDRAYKSGLVEACLPKEDFLGSVHRWVEKNISKLQAGERLGKEPVLGGMGGAIGSVLEHTPMGRTLMLNKAKDGVLSKTKGKYPAPLEAISVIRDTGGSYGKKLRGKSRESALEREARGFAKLVMSPESANLIRLFFMTESVKKSNGVPPDAVVAPKNVSSGGVLGAGVMGGGIAQLFAEKNIVCRMKDLNNQALALGAQAAVQIFKKQLKKRKINSREYQQKLNHIAPTTDYTAFSSLDIVIEAIVENMDVKKKVLKELEGQVSSSCIIASNTSSLSISEMQKFLQSPERFGGMHFFNPVHKMPLVEVIRGEKTSDQTVADLFKLSKTLGKTPIVVKDVPGFLVNRLLAPYMIEAVYLLADGVSIPEIDRALLDFGMPMGPMELMDEVGLDVADKVAHVLNEAYGPRMLTTHLISLLVNEKRLGKKNGIGLYKYEDKGRKKIVDPKVYEIMKVTPATGVISDQEIVERVVFPMINEASRCLEEKVVNSASELDLAMIMGMGFPPFKGGLLRYADSVGIPHIVERLSHHQKRFGQRFEPDASLRTRIQHDQKFCLN